MVLLAAVGAFVLVARPFLFPKHWDVVSIRQSAEFQDAALLERAWRMPVAASYRRAGIVYQPNGSICGPTSIANVMRSLGTRGATPQQVIAGTGLCSINDICFGGITLEDVAGLVRSRTGKRVTVLRDLSLADLRAELAHVNDPSRRYIANFDRGPLFGTGGGHHSPLLAYLADQDLVLVLDVNRSYRPWLVKTPRLRAALDTPDTSTGRNRGLLRIE